MHKKDSFPHQSSLLGKKEVGWTKQMSLKVWDSEGDEHSREGMLEKESVGVLREATIAVLSTVIRKGSLEGVF